MWTVVADGEWHTLAEIAELSGVAQTSVSARLRELRDPRFGCTVEREHLGHHQYRYRVTRSDG